MDDCSVVRGGVDDGELRNSNLQARTHPQLSGALRYSCGVSTSISASARGECMNRTRGNQGHPFFQRTPPKFSSKSTCYLFWIIPLKKKGDPLCWGQDRKETQVWSNLQRWRSSGSFGYRTLTRCCHNRVFLRSSVSCLFLCSPLCGLTSHNLFKTLVSSIVRLISNMLKFKNQPIELCAEPGGKLPLNYSVRNTVCHLWEIIPLKMRSKPFILLELSETYLWTCSMVLPEDNKVWFPTHLKFFHGMLFSRIEKVDQH